MAHRSGRHFLQIPGPDQRPRPHVAGDGPADHRSPRAGVRRARPGGAGRHQADLRTTASPSSSIRRPGTGAWEAAIVNTLSPGDQGADVRDRPFRDAMAQSGDQRFGIETGIRARRLAPRRRCRGGRSASSREDTRPRHQGRDGGPQRDLDRRHQPHSPESARPSTAPGIRRCCWWIPSRRWARSTTATTNGAWMSPSPVRRRG